MPRSRLILLYIPTYNFSTTESKRLPTIGPDSNFFKFTKVFFRILLRKSKKVHIFKSRKKNYEGPNFEYNHIVFSKEHSKTKIWKQTTWSVHFLKNYEFSKKNLEFSKKFISEMDGQKNVKKFLSTFFISLKTIQILKKIREVNSKKVADLIWNSLYTLYFMNSGFKKMFIDAHLTSHFYQAKRN